MRPSLVIIGLGNPGASYEHTRHNAGFHAADILAKEFGQGAWQDKQKFASVIQEARVVTVPILLVKPQTFMNDSGIAVRKLVDFWKLDPARQILVLSDDVDLPLGTLRLRTEGSAGTHNGLKSIVAVLGENFPRLRIGIGPKPEGADLATWVLSVPTDEERQMLAEAAAKAPDIVKKFVMECHPEH